MHIRGKKLKVSLMDKVTCLGFLLSKVGWDKVITKNLGKGEGCLFFFLCFQGVVSWVGWGGMEVGGKNV